MMGLLKKVGNVLATAANTTAVAVAHPLKVGSAFISPNKTVKEVREDFFNQPTGKRVTQTVLGSIALVATAAGGGAIAGAAKAGKLAPLAANVVKSVIPTTLKGKVAGLVAAPIVAGAVINQPKKTTNTILNAPNNLANVGGNIADLAADPSKENVQKLIKENPVTTSLLTGGLALGVGKYAIPPIITSISNERTREAIEEQTKVIKDQGYQPINDNKITIPTATPQNSNYQVSQKTPVTPQTTTISSGTSRSKKRKKSVKRAVMPSINQKVNVIVSNRNNLQNKRYLNRTILNV